MRPAVVLPDQQVWCENCKKWTDSPALQISAAVETETEVEGEDEVRRQTTCEHGVAWKEACHAGECFREATAGFVGYNEPLVVMSIPVSPVALINGLDMNYSDILRAMVAAAKDSFDDVDNLKKVTSILTTAADAIFAIERGDA